MSITLLACAAAAAKSLQSCLTLCNPTDGSPPGSSIPGILRQEHWSGLPFPSPMRESEVTRSCPTLRDPMGCSLPGSSIRGIFQARVLEWGAISEVILKILQARLQQYVNCELPDVQAGFRKGRGTRDQIANIHWIIEKAREFQKKHLLLLYGLDQNF